ncbi:DUF6355 family natural product biosynthesis protein [Allokutzneria sp. NRRL B-24872]|uniref:DUF6355 family natural product biosynthesis protein n=1 Tax=Allokutzneria sp. NRRL B-24872 TaxID=1137961 RepID=UPI0011783E6A|nr:DUF6355 family natural product biosynthesis protein [Allokutzneria sp. NRRL B-24872]
MRQRAAIVFATALAAMSLTAPMANAVPGCGGFRDGGYAYFYHHCGPTHVMIKIDVRFEIDRTKCVRPGDNLLWTKALGPVAEGAWYIGLC